MQGRVHSFETFGTVDGPGVRFVLFLQGCPLRCKYCHNPDTWEFNGGTLYESDAIVEKYLKYTAYYGKEGGITVSGGEPLVQIEFVTELFKKLKEHNVNTCLDTSGIMYTEAKKDEYLELFKYLDLVLLDVKHIRSVEHVELTGMKDSAPRAFAKLLDEQNIPVWIRHVLVPNITTQEEYLNELHDYIRTLHNVKKVEVLPYHSLGEVKYDNLHIAYVLKGLQPPSKEEIQLARNILEVKQ
ncbi:MAG: pyruvate formate-lyase-activating protein [Erysipelotrichaceae bacterium]